MNRITTLLMICMLCSTSAYCQYINVPTTIKTPYGNVKTSTSMYVGRPYYSSWKKFRSTDTYNIKVVFKNDSTVKTNGMLMVSDSMSIIALDSTTSIAPRDTKEIICITPGMRKAKGYPTDSSWQFQLNSGGIKAYSNLPFNEEAIVALQKDDNAPIPFSKELLLEWIGVSPKIVDMIEKGKYMQAIKYYNGQM